MRKCAEAHKGLVAVEVCPTDKPMPNTALVNLACAFDSRSCHPIYPAALG